MVNVFFLDWLDEIEYFFHFESSAGLDVHFLHVRPSHASSQKVLPLMLVHGWPGSFYEFYKILPLLTKNHEGITFEVIIPSIPGYGYSEASHKQGGEVLIFFFFNLRLNLSSNPFSSAGLDSLAVARIFLKLMERLGFSEFYVQGGDWGSLITTNMSQMKPEWVLNKLPKTACESKMFLSCETMFPLWEQIPKNRF